MYIYTNIYIQIYITYIENNSIFPSSRFTAILK